MSHNSLATSQPVVLQRGRIIKRSRHGVGRWLPRYWTLYTDGTLTYHESEKTSRKYEPSFEVNVTSQCYDVRRGAEACDCSFPRRVPSENCFGLVTATRVFYLYTDASEDCRRWMENISRMATNMISSNWNFTGMGTATPQSHRGLKKEPLSSSETSINEVGRDSGVFLVASTRESTVESMQATDDDTVSKTENNALEETLGEKVKNEEEMKLQLTENEQTRPAEEAYRSTAEDVTTQKAKKAPSMSYAGKRDSVVSCTSRETESEFVLSDTEVLMRTPSAGGETFKVDTKPRKKSGGKKSDGAKKRFPRFGRRKSKEQPKEEEKVTRASTENTGAVGFIKYRDADGVVRFAQVSAEEQQHGEQTGDTEAAIDELEAEPDIPEEEEPTEEQLQRESKHEVAHQIAPPETQQTEEKPSSGDDVNKTQEMNETQEMNKTPEVNDTPEVNETPGVNEAQIAMESDEAEVEEGKESEWEENKEETEAETADTDTMENPETESDLLTSPVRKRTLKPADSWIRRQSAMSRNLDDHKPAAATATKVKPAEEARTTAGSLVTQSPFMKKIPHTIQESPSKAVAELQQVSEEVPLTLQDMQGNEGRMSSESRVGGGNTDKVW